MSEYKAVPVEPTKEMLRAYAKAAPTKGHNGSTWTQFAPYARWKAMLAAAPQDDRDQRISELVRECVWVESDVDAPHYITQCEHSHWQGYHHYCTYCGGTIRIKLKGES